MLIQAMVNRFVLVGTDEGEVGIGEASEVLVNNEVEADQLEKAAGFAAVDF